MIYTKKIGDGQVLSECKTIQTNEGIWISNPSEEQIFDAGWEVYVPPEPQPMTEPDETSIIAAVKRMLTSSVEDLSDEDALEIAALYPSWISKMGMQVNSGERYWYDGKLYKVTQAHTVQSDWTPDVAVALFTEVSIEEWPEWKQPTGTQDAYMTGDKVTFNGQRYISVIDNNVWAPDVTGWSLA